MRERAWEIGAGYPPRAESARASSCATRRQSHADRTRRRTQRRAESPRRQSARQCSPTPPQGHTDPPACAPCCADPRTPLTPATLARQHTTAPHETPLQDRCTQKVGRPRAPSSPTAREMPRGVAVASIARLPSSTDDPSGSTADRHDSTAPEALWAGRRQRAGETNRRDGHHISGSQSVARASRRGTRPRRTRAAPDQTVRGPTAVAAAPSPARCHPVWYK
mmetsp:Transcript_11085/g.32882  ORF Transcript_11085/g.32882 Transcript_11085/m.32882 type:complete len:222 (-) Transcript_11085:672-1337(-)